MLRISALVVLAGLLTSPQQVEVEMEGFKALPAPNATACSTAPAGKAWLTTVTWANGSTTQHTNLRVTERLFKGPRMFVRPARKAGMPVVNRCTVRGDNVRVWTTGGAKVLTFQVPPPVVVTPPPLVEPLPTEPAPVVHNRWAGPVTLYSTLDASWRVAEAVIAWNTALPADRQITLSAEPCEKCITITEVPTITANASWWGAAYAQYNPGVMTHCMAEVASIVPASSRGHVASHEIGHCLGLPHWKYAASVMNSGDGEFWVPNGLPTVHDLAWLTSAYAATP